MPRRRIRSILVCVLLFVAGRAFATNFYVSPSGRPSGNGSLGNPWDLRTALSHPGSVQPGDVIWLRGGTYRGSFISMLTGASYAPITVRQYPGERATLDGNGATDNTLVIQNPWTIFWGFEVTNSDPSRPPIQNSRVTGVEILGSNVKVINLIVHDAGIGIADWSQSQNSEIAGCIIYDNGNTKYDHGIYVQNQTGTKTIQENLISNNFGYGIHAYGSSEAFLRNLVISGNVSFNNGSLSYADPEANILVSGGAPISNIQLLNNYTHIRPFTFTSARLYPNSPGSDITIQGNYFVGFTTICNWSTLRVSGNTFVGTTTLLEYMPGVGGSKTWDNNRFLSEEAQWQPFNLIGTPTRGLFLAGWRSATGFDWNSSYTKTTPRGTDVFVRPNPYESGRAHIIIYNWDTYNSVPVDLSSVLSVGDNFQVLKGQDYFGSPVVSGTWNGTPVQIPMAGLNAAKPVGLSVTKTTAPEFNAFVLVKVP
jgi:parallel beta-helix repeat protein